MKNRNNVNILIDFFLFAVLAILAGIGWLMKFKLPPGRDRILETGENRTLFFLGLDRHAWGEIHLIAALAMIGLLVLHVVFHWKTILCMLGNAIPARTPRRILAGSVVIASAVFFFGAFLIVPNASDTDTALYRHARRNMDTAETAASPPAVPPFGRPSPTTSREEAAKPPENPVEKTEDQEHSEHGNTAINGQITLSEAAAACGLSLEDVRRKLGLPEDYPGTETLGRLRRARGLTMIRIRELLGKKP